MPDLVLMTLVFFGGQILVNDIGDYLGWDYIDVSPFAAGVLTIGFIFGAYLTETFRGGILAVSPGEIEAGHAYGMTPTQVLLRITMPAMVRHALPGFSNNWLVLAKTTALVSVIGLQDMVFNAGQAGFATRQPFTFYLLVAMLFLAITGVSDLGLRWLRYGLPYHRTHLGPGRYDWSFADMAMAREAIQRGREEGVVRGFRDHHRQFAALHRGLVDHDTARSSSVAFRSGPSPAASAAGDIEPSLHRVLAEGLYLRFSRHALAGADVYALLRRGAV